MNYYEKTALYVYPKLDALIKGIDETFVRKIKESRYDSSPVLKQCEDLIKLTEIKENLIALKSAVEKVYDGLTDEDKLLVAYKYFKRGDKNSYEKSSRSYYRRQIKLAEMLKERFEAIGLTEAKFEKDFMSVPFIREEHKKVEKRERILLEALNSAGAEKENEDTYEKENARKDAALKNGTLNFNYVENSYVNKFTADKTAVNVKRDSCMQGADENINCA